MMGLHDPTCSSVEIIPKVIIASVQSLFTPFGSFKISLRPLMTPVSPTMQRTRIRICVNRIRMLWMALIWVIFISFETQLVAGKMDVSYDALAESMARSSTLATRARNILGEVAKDIPDWKEKLIDREKSIKNYVALMVRRG